MSPHLGVVVVLGVELLPLDVVAHGVVALHVLSGLRCDARRARRQERNGRKCNMCARTQ